MQKCSHIPSRRELRVQCTLGWEAYGQPQAEDGGASRNACINWNQYYNVCRSGEFNPHNGAINFDNIGYAWIAIFQVYTRLAWRYLGVWDGPLRKAPILGCDMHCCPWELENVGPCPAACLPRSSHWRAGWTSCTTSWMPTRSTTSSTSFSSSL